MSVTLTRPTVKHVANVDATTSLRLLNLYQELGIPVLPGPVHEKGCRVPGWPTIPPEQCWQLSREAIERGPCNLVGRVGDGLAVLDLDGKAGTPKEVWAEMEDRWRKPIALYATAHRLDFWDAMDELEAKAELAPSPSSLVCGLLMVVKTARGFHFWVRAKESVGDGFSSLFGGEILSHSHLVNLPPSIHPDGSTYSIEGTHLVNPDGSVCRDNEAEHARLGIVDHPWRTLLRPAQPLDLRALGLVPDLPKRNVNRPTRNGSQSTKESASVSSQHEFVHLMAQVGVHRANREQECHICPWHDDSHESLSVSWPAALFYCHSCGEQGGIGRLRQLLGMNSQITNEKEGHPPGVSVINVQTLRDRLAMSPALGQQSKAMADCKRFVMVRECSGGHKTAAAPVTCGIQLCPICGPDRLARD